MFIFDPIETAFSNQHSAINKSEWLKADR